MTDDLTRFAEQIPLVTDRVLLELANGLTVASARTAQRSGRGIIARLAAQITGRDHQAQLMMLRSLIDGQQAITDWLVEVTARSTVSDLALAQVTTHLAQTSRMVADVRDRHQQLAGELQGLSELVADLAQTCVRRLDGLESWRTEVTLHMAAERDFQLTTERWQAGESSDSLPDVRRRQLVAEVLGSGLDPQLALPAGPLTSTAAITMELAALPANIQPSQPAHMALELVRRRLGWLDGGATLSGFVRAAIREQMETASFTWQRLEIGK